MSKKIYVGLQKLGGTELAAVARQTSIDHKRLQLAAKGQVKLSDAELEKLSAVILTRG
jgi:hypothetical protein